MSQSIENDGKEFINPYTFVPIEKEVIRSNPSKDRSNPSEDSKKSSGVLKCELTIANDSSIFIPNTSKAFAENGQPLFYEFYSYEDLSNVDKIPSEGPSDPVIPGSEIRGMIRNVYEQLTNSCMPIIDAENLPYKRTTEPKTNYGMLRYEECGWKLYKLYHNKDREDEISEVERYKIINNNIAKKLYRDQKGIEWRVNGGRYGYAQKRSTDNQKKIIYRPEMISNDSKLDTEELTGDNEKKLERLRYVLETYTNKKINQSYMSYKTKLEDSYYKYDLNILNKPKEGDSIFVYADETYEYLSPACIGKECFIHSIEELLDKQGGHAPCSDANNVCPACKLFGMVSEKGAIQSSLRFTDGIKVGEVKYEDICALNILGTPRISATEFYLQRPDNIQDGNKVVDNVKDICTWNYDYFTIEQSNYKGIHKRSAEKSDKVRISYDAKLSGRKVYWHGKFHPLFLNKNQSDSPNKNNSTYKDRFNSEIKNNMTCRVRRLKSGRFSFKVYFENLTEKEISNIVFCLELNNVGIHKIGKGKPIGMGDVKITVKEIKLREYQYDSTKPEVTVKNVPQEKTRFKLMKDKNIDENVKAILKYTAPLSEKERCLVDYPRPIKKSEKGQIYKWFSNNRGSVNNPIIEQDLPKLLDDKNKTLQCSKKNTKRITKKK